MVVMKHYFVHYRDQWKCSVISMKELNKPYHGGGSGQAVTAVVIFNV